MFRQIGKQPPLKLKSVKVIMDWPPNVGIATARACKVVRAMKQVGLYSAGWAQKSKKSKKGQKKTHECKKGTKTLKKKRQKVKQKKHRRKTHRNKATFD